MSRASVLILVAWLLVSYRGLGTAGWVYDGHSFERARLTAGTWPWPVPSRELTVQTFRWQAQLGAGATATPYHLVNLALHTAVSLLAWGLGRQLGLGILGATAALVVFSLHPIQAEAVASMSGRTDLLLALGSGLAVWLILAGRSGGAWLGSAMCVGVALVSKEIGVAAVGLVILAVAWRGGRVWPLGALVVVSGTWIAAAHGPSFVADPTLNLGTGAWLTAQAGRLSQLAGWLVWPVGIAVEPSGAPGAGSAAVAVAALGLAPVLAWSLRARAPYIWWATLWVGITLAPRFLIETPDLLNPYHLYVPLLGLSVGLGGAVETLDRWLAPGKRECSWLHIRARRPWRRRAPSSRPPTTKTR